MRNAHLTFEDAIEHLDDWIALVADAGFAEMAAPARALKARYVAYRPFYDQRAERPPAARLAIFDPKAQRDWPEGD